MQILLASNNAHKLDEIRAILDGTGVEIVSLDRFPDVPEAPETGETFEANALQKARFVHARTGLPTVADDSGLEVAALNWGPGVHSKRFTPAATAESNNAQLLRSLAGESDRRARFRCAMAVVDGGTEGTAEGRCEGQIGTDYAGEGGFGYDPLFRPDEAPGRAMAELSPAEKNAISHRGRAFSQLPALLARLGLQPT